MNGTARSTPNMPVSDSRAATHRRTLPRPTGRATRVSVRVASVPLVTTQFRFTSSLWAHDIGGWRFLTLPTTVTEGLRDEVPPTGPGFGSIRVTVTLGSSTWDTSVFPDKASGSFVLPVKKDVRRANQLLAGDAVDVALRVRNRPRARTAQLAVRSQVTERLRQVAG